MAGMPFPSIRSPELQKKTAYLDHTPVSVSSVAEGERRAGALLLAVADEASWSGSKACQSLFPGRATSRNQSTWPLPLFPRRQGHQAPKGFCQHSALTAGDGVCHGPGLQGSCYKGETQESVESRALPGPGTDTSAHWRKQGNPEEMVGPGHPLGLPGQLPSVESNLSSILRGRGPGFSLGLCKKLPFLSCPPS
ncbi:uncharacterized protein LOC105738865 [Nomascus leucogenys]|uniref:uncharacterized protein LOC105738865 n=1 Tax=Nomascus leucogenys TaxID=61853 RepID=UPI00122D5BA1|nr:uncharacterized protein LOC105738865 [Nomascus leucogenys]